MTKAVKRTECCETENVVREEGGVYAIEQPKKITAGKSSSPGDGRFWGCEEHQRGNSSGSGSDRKAV
jgi:hypothetical protein